MEPILKMSAISTLKDLTEAFVGLMVSGLLVTPLLWKGSSLSPLDRLFNFFVGLIPDLETKGLPFQFTPVNYRNIRPILADNMR